MGNESVKGIMPSSRSACVGFTVRRGSRKRLSSAKTCKRMPSNKSLTKKSLPPEEEKKRRGRGGRAVYKNIC